MSEQGCFRLGRAPVFIMALILVKLAVDWGTHKYEHRELNDDQGSGPSWHW